MFQILNPKIIALFALPILGAIYFWFRPLRWKGSKLSGFSLWDDFIQKSQIRIRWYFRILFLAWILVLLGLIAALCRPVWNEQKKKITSNGIDLLLVMDVSESMEADDLKPNRFTALKKVVQEFVKSRPYDRIGLVLFGGEAITKAPLTMDHPFLLEQVQDARMRELKQGTAIGQGLANGVSRFRGSSAKTKVIILLTDGDSNVGAINPITAAQLARESGIRIYTIGIGESDRVMVPIYQYDADGNRQQLLAQVPSYLNPELLARIARITGGKAYMARDNGMLSLILKEIDRLEKSKVKVELRTERHEWYQYPLAAALVLAILIFIFEETRFRRVRQYAV